MKVTIALFALATVSQVQAHGIRTLQALCPIVNNTGSCSTDLNRVMCGNGCEYDNECIAATVGFLAGCTLIDVGCPSTGPPGQCTLEETPAVECGDDKCQYPSYCLANFAGFGESSCCGIPPADTICTMEEAPVKCGACTYANQCLADAAGATGCEKGATPCNPTTEAYCPDVPPPPSEGTPCNMATGSNCTPEQMGSPSLSSTAADTSSAAETTAASAAGATILSGSLVLAGAIAALVV